MKRRSPVAEEEVIPSSCPAERDATLGPEVTPEVTDRDVARCDKPKQQRKEEVSVTLKHKCNDFLDIGFRSRRPSTTITVESALPCLCYGTSANDNFYFSLQNTAF